MYLYIGRPSASWYHPHNGNLQCCILENLHVMFYKESSNMSQISRCMCLYVFVYVYTTRASCWSGLGSIDQCMQLSWPWSGMQQHATAAMHYHQQPDAWPAQLALLEHNQTCVRAHYSIAACSYVIKLHWSLHASGTPTPTCTNASPDLKLVLVFSFHQLAQVLHLHMWWYVMTHCNLPYQALMQVVLIVALGTPTAQTYHMCRWRPSPTATYTMWWP